MRKTPFKLLAARFPIQHAAFMKMVEQWEEITGDPREEFELDKFVFYWNFGDDVPAHVLATEHLVSGPREPAWVWTGERWICSEDELSDSEKRLMDAVAAHCPGGLAGWS